MPDWHPLHRTEQRTKARSELQEEAMCVSSFCCELPLMFSNPEPFQGLRGLLNPKQPVVD